MKIIEKIIELKSFVESYQHLPRQANMVTVTVESQLVFLVSDPDIFCTCLKLQASVVSVIAIDVVHFASIIFFVIMTANQT